MASDKPYHVCQLSEETGCAHNSDCPTGQLCGVDARCRDQCAADRDCVSEQVCAQATCAEPTELIGGKLRAAQPDGGTVLDASIGLPSSYNSECPAPLICGANLCAHECLGTPTARAVWLAWRTVARPASRTPVPSCPARTTRNARAP
ncbi:MAG: hypothetical protein MUF54_21325 [Polyangiaceae bacterium]|nr:hypothetical protein [Polyangiaceae bacterium]